MKMRFARVISLIACCAGGAWSGAARAQESEAAATAPVDPGATVPNTPRDGVLSGGYLGVDVGMVALRKSARDRLGLGHGLAFQLRLGAALWDQLVLGGGIGFYTPTDERPTSELVVDCTASEGMPTTCGDDPYPQSSDVSGSFMSVEGGYQRRFRPWTESSLVPGALVGYVYQYSAAERGVSCEGCPDAVPLDTHISGVYLAPFVRLTIGAPGYYALVVRSQVFLNGDFIHITTLGAELGLP